MTLTPGTRLGPYEITGPLGAGGMGEVYRAKDTMLARDVAIKSLPEAFAQDVERLGRFEREARVLASLNHPNVAAIHGIQEADGERYLVLEFVDGETLAARIARGPLPVDEAVDVCKQIAAGVEAAHESGVIHRDLKPGNVMLAPDGHVKVLDFGLATSGSAGRSGSGSDLTHSPTLTSPATRAGVILGTAAYMSPEQARGKNVDRRTDIWSFGCVLYECLTGRSLFGGETVSDVIARILEREPDWGALPAETPPRVVELLKRCLRKDPKARLRDIGDARLELSEAHAVPASGAAEAAQPAPARASRLPWMIGAGVLAVALAASLVFRPHGGPPDARPLVVSVAVPAGLTVSADVPDVVPSPDGRSIVFVAADSAGTRRLYLRALDSPDVRRLPDTDGALLPFWSPDSRNIAFFAAGSLERMAIDGGAQVLCAAPNPRGAAWSPRGIIVFNPRSSGPLMKIPDTGGTPVPATTLDSTRAETAHRFPCFLPDGTHFLYVALTGKDEVDTRVGSLDDPAPGPVIVNALGEARYAAPGYLVFNQRGSILAQPFDPKTRKLTGAPHVVRGLGKVSGHYAGVPVVMVGGDGMIAQREEQGSDTRMVLLDRTGRTVRSLKLPRGAYTYPAFSPDGSRIAFEYGTSGAYNQTYAWVVDVARSIATRITFDGLYDETPIWTPDGKRIVVGSGRPGGRDLYWINADGSGTEDLIVDMPNLFNNPTSVTSDAVVFRSLHRETNEDIWIAPLHGDGKAKPLLNSTFNETDAKVSPDGRWMAYFSDESGRSELYVVAFPSMADKVRVSVNGATAGPLSTAPTMIGWRRDGKELYFMGTDGRTLMVAPVETGSTFHAGTPQPLLTMPPETLDGTVSPDGQTILAVLPASGNARSVINLLMNWQAGLEKGK